MLVDRLNLETNQIEQVEAIGIVQFVGKDKQADLTHNHQYYVIGFHNNLLQIIDDSQDYYYYIPFDANDIGQKEGIVSGFHIIQDDTGKITELFENYKIQFTQQQTKNEKKLSHKIIQWKLNKLKENK